MDSPAERDAKHVVVHPPEDSASPSSFSAPFSPPRMDRNESANEGGSSPDTVVGRSSSEEDRNRYACSTSGEYVTVGDSSSSLDTLTNVGAAAPPVQEPSVAEDKKRGRFGALKNSFRKEGGLFKIKKKNRSIEETFAETEPDADEKGSFTVVGWRMVEVVFEHFLLSVWVYFCWSISDAVCFRDFRFVGFIDGYNES